MVRENDLLINCLAELDQRGWDVEEYLADRPDLSESLRAMLRAAARLHDVPRPLATAEFRTRVHARFAARSAVDDPPTRSRPAAFRRSAGTILRPLAKPVAAALILAFAFGGVRTASASALPGTPLYPAKLAVEQIQLFVAYTPELQTDAHLSVAATRVQDAAAESRRGNHGAATSLLESSEQQIKAAEAAASQVRSPDYHQHVVEVVASLRAQQQHVALPVAQSKESRGGTEKASASSTSAGQSTGPRTAPDGTNVGGRGGASIGHQDKAGNDRTPIATGPSQPESTDSSSGGHAQGQPAAQPAPVAGDPTEQLLKTLIAQAMAGDSTGASETSTLYVSAVQALAPDHSGHGDATNRLQQQRDQLQAALPQVPASTSQSIQDALSAVDTALAAAPGADHPIASGGNPGSSDNGPVTGSSVATPTPTATPDGRPGNGANHDSSDGHQSGGGNGNGKGH